MPDTETFVEKELATEGVIQLSSWSEFQNKLEWLNAQVVQVDSIDKQFEYPIFRGQAQHHSRWKLETTLERFACSQNNSAARSLLAYYRKATICKPILESLTGRTWPDVPDFLTFQNRLRENPYGWLDTFLNGAGVYEYLVYLRHHGFPSPLLDWTASPFVAAFFAFDHLDRDVEHVCVYAFLEKRLRVVSSDRHFFVVGPYMRTDQRHYVQQCRYSLCVKAEGEDFVFLSHDATLTDQAHDQGMLYEFRIPVEERQTALRHLDLMNINPHSLFVSEDSLVRALARRECDFKSW